MTACVGVRLWLAPNESDCVNDGVIVCEVVTLGVCSCETLCVWLCVREVV